MRVNALASEQSCLIAAGPASVEERVRARGVAGDIWRDALLRVRAQELHRGGHVRRIAVSSLFELINEQNQQIVKRMNRL